MLSLRRARHQAGDGRPTPSAPTTNGARCRAPVASTDSGRRRVVDEPDDAAVAEPGHARPLRRPGPRAAGRASHGVPTGRSPHRPAPAAARPPAARRRRGTSSRRSAAGRRSRAPRRARRSRPDRGPGRHPGRSGWRWCRRSPPRLETVIVSPAAARCAQSGHPRPVRPRRPRRRRCPRLPAAPWPSLSSAVTTPAGLSSGHPGMTRWEVGHSPGSPNRDQHTRKVPFPRRVHPGRVTNERRWRRCQHPKAFQAMGAAAPRS